MQASRPDPRQFVQTLLQLTPRLYVTHVLIGINVAVFVVMVLSGVNVMSPTVAQLLAWGADYGPRTLAGEPWRMATCMFLHVGIIHLAVNMWVLWQIGKLVERLVGNVGYLLVYLLSGLGGSLASLFWNPLTVSAGASGAVFGLFGVLLGFIVFARHSIPLAAFRSLVGSTIGFLVFNMAFGIALPGIDVAAHLGGFVAGVFCGLAVSQPIEPGAASRRWWRNAATGVVGALLVVGGTQLLSAPTIDVIDLNNRFEAEVRRTQKLYQQEATRYDAREITASAMADILENEILPPYQALRDEFREASQVRSRFRELLERRAKFLELTSESWSLLAQALRTGDRQLRERSDQLYKEASKVLAR